MAAEEEVYGGREYPAHYKVMMDKLNEQRQLDQFTDITLIVDGKGSIAHFYVICITQWSESGRQDTVQTLSFNLTGTKFRQCSFELM